jgi:hypothetical protein
MTMTRSIQVALVAGAALTVAGLLSCGGSPPSTPTTTTTTTTTTPTTTRPSAGDCSPSPPPLFRMRLKVHDNGDGYRRVLDSRPEVIDMNGYCNYRGFGTAKTCFTAHEGDPQMYACDKMATGQASDTGRWGPTWAYKPNMGAPAQPCSETAKPGCINHPDNQYLVIGKGQGVFQACAAADIPLSTNPAYPGSRCSYCQLAEGQGWDKYCH